MSVDLVAYRNSGYLKRVGSIYHPLLEAVCGQNALDLGVDAPMAMAMEVYQSVDSKFTVLQFRSRIVDGASVKQVWTALESWLVNDLKAKQVLILTGVDATRCFDAQLGDQNRCRSIGELEGVSQLEPTWPMQLGSQVPVLPGAGALPHYALMSKSIECKVLMIFTVDGNNIPDAECITQVLEKSVFKSKANNLDTTPPSWSTLYGNCLPEVELYQ